jgi:hypothetical protein
MAWAVLVDEGLERREIVPPQHDKLGFAVTGDHDSLTRSRLVSETSVVGRDLRVQHLRHPITESDEMLKRRTTVEVEFFRGGLDDAPGGAGVGEHPQSAL